MSRSAAGRIVTALDRRGLRVPAGILVDAHRPLGPLLSDIGAAIGPMYGALVGARGDSLRALLESPTGIDDLHEELEGARADAG